MRGRRRRGGKRKLLQKKGDTLLFPNQNRRLIMLDPSQYRILNWDDIDDEVKPVKPMELSQSLYKMILRLKGIYLSMDGSKVDYAKLREDSRFQDFEKETCLLIHVDLTLLNEQGSKAFFINIYNTLTIHALVVSVKQERAVLELEKFWQKNAYRVGPHVFSLDDIEHGILRGNKLHPTHNDYFFKENDPRRAFVQVIPDPRIHFALNCGAKSCPPVRLFTAEDVDKALDLATRAFCQDDVIIDVPRALARMTKIFMWYGTDFGCDEKSILLWLKNYVTEQQQVAIGAIIDQSPQIEYNDYNWDIC